MDEKAKVKRSELDKSNLGSTSELEPHVGKKKKHKERKKKRATDETLNSNETLEENCTGEKESSVHERKKKKGRKDIDVMDSNVADNEEVHVLDENRQSKMKKRKNSDDSSTGMLETGSSKPSKKGKMTEDSELKNNEVKKMEKMEKKKKKKLSEESQHNEYDGFKSNEDEDDDQGKKMKKKKKLSEESQRDEYDGFKSNEGEDDDRSKKMKKKKKKKLSEESQHNEYDEFKSNEGEDDDQGKKKKNEKKKLIEESKSKEEYNEFRSNESEDGEQDKMKKKKLRDKSKSKNSEFHSNEGDPSLARVVAGDADAHGIVTEVDDQSKNMKTKKKAKEVTGESSNPAAHGGTSKPRRVTFSDQVEVFEDDDQGKKNKNKKKKLIEESKSKEYNEFRSNEGEDGEQDKIKKKKLRDKSKSKNSEFNSNEGDPSLARVEAGDADARGIVTEVDDESKNTKTKKKAKEVTGESSNPAAHGGTSKPKRVTFSDQVEVCGDTLVRGKRFTPEEDEKIKEAVFDYIESHGLGDEGLDMILHCKSHSKVRNCWKEIGEVLPMRPHLSVYYRAHILFERDEKRKWTQDELEFLRKLQDQHGSDWKKIAEALGKHRFHVKDAWRRIRQTNTNKGRWTQDEYQQLFDLVNKDLRARAAEECRKSKHGMLRDNVSWEAISDKFGARTSSHCCQKWYKQLTSPMVADGVWTDTDDYRLLNALYSLDACSMEEVDWDNLLEHRSGDVSRKRWNQMVRNIGEHGAKSFAEQVEVLAKRFSPDLLEAREAFDSKPVVG